MSRATLCAIIAAGLLGLAFGMVLILLATWHMGKPPIDVAQISMLFFPTLFGASAGACVD